MIEKKKSFLTLSFIANLQAKKTLTKAHRIKVCIIML